jgi:hypothetical protein
MELMMKNFESLNREAALLEKKNENKFLKNMGTNYQEGDRFYQAEKRVKEIKEFYEHLTVYILVNPIVIVVNLMTSPEYLYFIWSLLGWGVAVVLHGLKVFSFGLFFNKEWEEKQISKLLEKENEKQIWK